MIDEGAVQERFYEEAAKMHAIPTVVAIKIQALNICVPRVWTDSEIFAWIMELFNFKEDTYAIISFSNCADNPDNHHIHLEFKAGVNNV